MGHGQNPTRHLFLLIKLYWNTAMPMGIPTAHGCCRTPRAEPSGCNRDQMACRAENIDYLALYRKSSPAPVPEPTSQWERSLVSHPSPRRLRLHPTHPTRQLESSPVTVWGAGVLPLPHVAWQDPSQPSASASSEVEQSGRVSAGLQQAAPRGAVCRRDQFCPRDSEPEADAGNGRRGFWTRMNVIYEVMYFTVLTWVTSVKHA